MLELPVFPLHTVLFPGEPLRLHIFEPRYRRLIQDCLAERMPFGVALIRSGREAGGPLPDAFRVGCLMELVQAEPLPYGRYQLYCRARERFQVLDWLEGRPYRMAAAMLWPLRGAVAPDREMVLRSLIRTYLRLLPLGHEPPLNPDDASLHNLLFRAAANLPVSLLQKQMLLEAANLSLLLEDLLLHYRKEISLLRVMRSAEQRRPVEEGSPLKFSVN